MSAVEDITEPTPRALLSRCRGCRTRLVAGRWVARDGFRSSAKGGVRLRLVRDVPGWAAVFALQGVAIVTRYRCPLCGRVAAVLARDAK